MFNLDHPQRMVLKNMMLYKTGNRF